MKLNELKSFYEKHLQEQLLPFWLKRCIDKEDGGYLNGFNNLGNATISTDKYTWSQGRFLYLFSKLALSFSYLERDYSYKSFADHGAKFIIEHAILDNGHAVYLMDKKGNPIKAPNQDSLDASIFADAFVVIGMAAYSQLTKNKDHFDFTIKTYLQMKKRIENNNYLSEPYPIADQLHFHAIPMIELSVSMALSDANEFFNDKRLSSLEDEKNKYINEILQFQQSDGLIHEMISTNKEILESNDILLRYINPGHTLEDMGFVLLELIKKEDKSTITTVLEIVKKTFNIGWDKEYNGLFLFVDPVTIKPSKPYSKFSDSSILKKVLNDWDLKLWWPHSESLFTLLLSYVITNDNEFYEMYKKTHDYTFNTFPNKDKDILEWIQIRDRYSEPLNRNIALPVKDPFHIIRSFLCIIEILSDID